MNLRIMNNEQFPETIFTNKYSFDKSTKNKPFAKMKESFVGEVTMQYKWKTDEWKTLRHYPKLYAEYEMIRLQRMYSHEYEFRLV